MRVLALAILLAGLGGCSALDPYETIPLNPTKDARPRVGMCFDELRSTPDEVRAAAQAACDPGTTAVREDTDYGLMTLQVCPSLLPGRATFICERRK